MINSSTLFKVILFYSLICFTFIISLSTSQTITCSSAFMFALKFLSPHNMTLIKSYHITIQIWQSFSLLAYALDIRFLSSYIPHPNNALYALIVHLPTSIFFLYHYHHYIPFTFISLPLHIFICYPIFTIIDIYFLCSTLWISHTSMLFYMIYKIVSCIM